MKFYIHTTGCKANQWDSTIIAGRLLDAGFDRGDPSDADVIVVNACALTEGAERDVRRFIAGQTGGNGKARIILTGCHGQIYPEKSFGAHTVIGQSEKFKVEAYIHKEGTFVSEVADLPMERAETAGLSQDRTRFFYKIQDGCDHFCAYCVVPFGRGKPRSRSLPEVMETMGILAEREVKEVVLTGIELSAYRDPHSGVDLKGLLRLIEERATPPRVRLSSIDPLYLDAEFIDIIAHSHKVAKSLHIPLQSGSDRILKKMGRNYTGSYIETTVKRLLERVDGIGIGMDVITGFPTEDDDDFMATYRLLDSLHIYYLHVFPFSARQGTRAAGMEGKVPSEVKKRRVSALKKLDSAKRRAFHERLVGREVRIVPEGRVYKGAYMRGYTDNYVPVYLPFKKGLENNLVRVKIERIEGEMLMGVKVEEGQCSYSAIC